MAHGHLVEVLSFPTILSHYGCGIISALKYFQVDAFCLDSHAELPKSA